MMLSSIVYDGIRRVLYLLRKDPTSMKSKWVNKKAVLNMHKSV